MTEILDNGNEQNTGNDTPAEGTPESIDDGIPVVTFSVEVSRTVQAPVDASLSIAGQAADAKATGDAINAAKDELQAEIDNLGTNIAAVANLLFPVGTVIVTTSATAPEFGSDNWNWQEVKLLPLTQGDLIDGTRNYAAIETGDTPGTLHFWMRIADTEVTEP